MLRRKMLGMWVEFCILLNFGFEGLCYVQFKRRFDGQVSATILNLVLRGLYEKYAAQCTTCKTHTKYIN